IKADYALACVNTSPDYVNPSGGLVVVDISNVLSLTEVSISPDGKYNVIAIENERDEDLGNGGIYEPSDPEPEFVSIKFDNIALVSLQENNGFALIDLASAMVIDSFTAGTVSLDYIDTVKDKMIMQVDSLADVPREPGGVVWIGTDYFAAANEGDMLGGSRGFTVYSKDGSVAYESGNSFEHFVTAAGHYPDHRCGKKGNEPENVDYAADLNMLFVVSESGSAIGVYDVSDPTSPVFHQCYPPVVGPKGTKYLPGRQLFVAACEKDARDDKIRSAVVIYEYGADAPSYPGILSVEDPEIENGVPIPWAAMSGLAAGEGSTLYAVDDLAFKKSIIFFIDTSTSPASLYMRIRITGADGVFAGFSSPEGTEFSADDLATMINDDGTVNIDSEGIAVDPVGGFWVASEERGTVGDENRPIESLNFVFKLDDAGVIEQVVTLPDEVNAIQLRFHFEGVAVDCDYVVVAFQRAWGVEANPRLGLYNTVEDSWKFVFYPLDAPESQNGGWVGLSDITAVGDGSFLVLERDNQGGPDAAIKRIYSVDLGDLDAVEDGSDIEKRLVLNLIDVLKSTGGQMYEKPEGVDHERQRRDGRQLWREDCKFDLVIVDSSRAYYNSPSSHPPDTVHAAQESRRHLLLRD
ncbi:hypothetical protein ACHAWF_005463, partial [Thalassiosira exigua]